MQLSCLRLRNFRNYGGLDLALSPGLTVLQGANGQGKSNLLEAIHYLSLLRSFRTCKVADLIRHSAAGFRIEGILEKARNRLSQEHITVVQGEQRILQTNQNKVARASDFINRFFAVALTAQDIDLVKGPPTLRRRFCNILAARIAPGYLNHLISYTNALRQRNVVLRRPGKYGLPALNVYNRLLVEHGMPIMQARDTLLAELNLYLQAAAGKMGEKQAVMQIKYAVSFSSQSRPRSISGMEERELAEHYLEMLQREQSRDQDIGATRYGPHRDDLLFLHHGQPMPSFASEGQMRLLVLALHLAAASMLLNKEPSKPLVLLADDMWGELDAGRRRLFLEAIGEYPQTMLACTSVPTELAKTACRTLTVENGRIIEV